MALRTGGMIEAGGIPATRIVRPAVGQGLVRKRKNRQRFDNRLVTHDQWLKIRHDPDDCEPFVGPIGGEPESAADDVGSRPGQKRRASAWLTRAAPERVAASASLKSRPESNVWPSVSTAWAVVAKKLALGSFPCSTDVPSATMPRVSSAAGERHQVRGECRLDAGKRLDPPHNIVDARRYRLGRRHTSHPP